MVLRLVSEVAMTGEQEVDASTLDSAHLGSPFLLMSSSSLFGLICVFEDG